MPKNVLLSEDGPLCYTVKVPQPNRVQRTRGLVFNLVE